MVFRTSTQRTARPFGDNLALFNQYHLETFLRDQCGVSGIGSRKMRGELTADRLTPAGQSTLVDTLLTHCEMRSLLFDPSANRRLFDAKYAGDFINNEYEAPEVIYARLPGAYTQALRGGEVKIVLNPVFHSFSPEYRLCALLDQLIHVEQAKRGDAEISPRAHCQRGIEASQLLLDMGQRLGFSDARMRWIETQRDHHRKQLANLN